MDVSISQIFIFRVLAFCFKGNGICCGEEVENFMACRTIIPLGFLTIVHFFASLQNFLLFLKNEILTLFPKSKVALPETENDIPPHSVHHNERSSLLWIPGTQSVSEEKKGKLVKAILYGVQVFYSFFIM